MGYEGQRKKRFAFREAIAKVSDLPIARTVVRFFIPFLIVSCQSSFLKYANEEDLKKNSEFDREVHVERGVTPADAKVVSPSPESGKPVPAPPSTLQGPLPSEIAKDKQSGIKTKKSKKEKKTEQLETPLREPELEDSEGFTGRRPTNDPYHVGEVVTHDVHYFKVSAGELKFKVEPHSVVNGRKSYSFVTEIKTSSLFGSFYRVDDRAETLVDFETLVPSVFFLHVKESGQLREARSVFDWTNNLAKFWEKKVTDKDGVEEKRLEWSVQPFSQNVYSAIFYMRTFQWRDGKEYAFRVADDEENLVFRGKVLRREVLDTKIGPMKSIVIQPEFTVKGMFKPVGDIKIWLSDDDRKYVLRIESKIKIGTLVSEVIQIEPGT